MKIPTHRLFVLAPLALVAIAAILVAGCGGGDDTTTTTENESETAATGGGAGATLEIKMGEFFFARKTPRQRPGRPRSKLPTKARSSTSWCCSRRT